MPGNKRLIGYDLSFVGDGRITGVERFSLELYARLKDTMAAGYVVFVPKGFNAVNKNVKNVWLPSKSKALNHFFWLPIFSLIFRVDTIFFPSFPPGALFMVFFGKRKVRVLHDAVYWDSSSSLSLKAKVYLKPLELLWLKFRCYTSIVTVSEYSRKRLGEILGRQLRIDVVPNGVSRGFANTGSKKIGNNNRFILSVGTIEPRKNYEFLVDVYERVLEEAPDLRLVICGRPGWGKQALLKKISQSQAGAKISVIEGASDTELSAYYESCALFVFPSKEEGFGIPIIEAMSKGALVVAADNTAISEIVDGAGILVRDYVVDDWAAIISKCLSGEIDKSQYSKDAESRALQYSWDVAAQKLDGILKHEK